MRSRGSARCFDRGRLDALLEKVAASGCTAAVMSARGAGSMVERQMHNLRQRYRWRLRDEVAHIVQHPADVNDEIRYLCAALAESELT